MWKVLSSARFKSALQRSTEENTKREASMASMAARESSKQGNGRKAIVGVVLFVFVLFVSTRTTLVMYSDVCLLFVLMPMILPCMLSRLMQCPNLHTSYISATDLRSFWQV